VSEPFDRTLWQLITKEPYRSARRVSWLVDTGSPHRGPKSVAPLQTRRRNVILAQQPLHASRLNQIETNYPSVQPNLLEPNDSDHLADRARTLNTSAHHRNEITEPSDRNLTRHDPTAPPNRLKAHPPQPQPTPGWPANL
jgi:hypothetical protein